MGGERGSVAAIVCGKYESSVQFDFHFTYYTIEILPSQEIGNRGAQATAEAMDRNGNLFFGLINPIGLGCWDSTRSYGRETVRVVAQNDDTLQFPSGLKVGHFSKQIIKLVKNFNCKFIILVSTLLNIT